jgi:SPP1 family phage portal protein
MSDIKTALDLIIERREDYKKAEAYYEGNEDEIFASRRWHRIFKHDKVDFKFNFVRTVVDSVLNRLELASVTATTPEATQMLNQMIEQEDFEIDANEIHKKALVYGDCYAIVWPDEDGQVMINYNSPLTTAVIYDPENPRKKSFAAKLWQSYDADGRKIIKLNLYYRDRIEKYEVMGDLDSLGTAPTFIPMETVTNPWGEVPVFHFRTQKQYGRPEHTDAIGPQDAINKLISTHMYTVDYQGAPQRYALSSGGNDAEFEDFENDAAARENIGALKNGPGELWYLKGVNSVGQFAPADPATFTNPVKEFVRAMASITSTPLHYFEKSGNIPSGEALRTAEGPLMKKVEDRQISFGSAWRDLFRFMLRIEGINSDVEIKWQQVETMDSLDAWEVAVKKRLVGVNLEQVLVEMGYDLEIAQNIAQNADVAALSQNMNTTNILRENGVQA